MQKYLGDAIIKGNLTVQTDKPLDSRLVVQNSTELYTIDPTYAYVGMPVISIEDNTIYILKNKSKINLPIGWKKVSGDGGPVNPNPQPDPQPSVEQRKIVVLEEDEYNSLEEKEQDTLYFILEPIDGWMFPITLKDPDDGWVFPITLGDDSELTTLE